MLEVGSGYEHLPHETMRLQAVVPSDHPEVRCQHLRGKPCVDAFTYRDTEDDRIETGAA